MDFLSVSQDFPDLISPNVQQTSFFRPFRFSRQSEQSGSPNLFLSKSSPSGLASGGGGEGVRLKM